MKSDKALKSSTIEKYQNEFRLLESKFRKDQRLGESEIPKWGEFAKWIIAKTKKEFLSESYARLLRSAAMYCLSEMNDEEAQTGYLILQSWEIEDRNHQKDSPTKKNAGTANRKARPAARMIPQEDWGLIIDYFNKTRSESAIRAQMMVAAGVGCGARPIEWIRAKLVGENVIRIYNAKIKNRNAWDKIPAGIFWTAITIDF